MIYLIKFIYADKSTDNKYFRTKDQLVAYMRLNKSWMDTQLQDYVLFECKSIRREVNQLLRVPNE